MIKSKPKFKVFINMKHPQVEIENYIGSSFNITIRKSKQEFIRGLIKFLKKHPENNILYGNLWLEKQKTIEDTQINYLCQLTKQVRDIESAHVVFIPCSKDALVMKVKDK